MNNFKNIPGELRNLQQWAVWRLIVKAGQKKSSKIPFQPNGKPAAADNPDSWCSFQEAVTAFNGSDGKYSGIGFFLNQDDPYIAIDLDSDENKPGFACMQDGGLLGVLTDEGQEIIRQINSYAEYSQSGTGIHIIARGSVPGGRNRVGNFECYDKARFLVMTGDRLSGAPMTIESRQAELNIVYARFFGSTPVDIDEQHYELPLPKSPPLEDNEILSIARSALNKDKFSELYDLGNLHRWGEDASSADQALVNMLAFYTQDLEQLDRLFRGSALVREKWTEREDYRLRTIKKAIRDLKAWYGRVEFDTGDKGNAERLIHHFQPIMRYCAPLGGWLIWDGCRWAPDETEQATLLALMVSERIEREEIAPIWDGLTEPQRDQLANFSRKDSPPEIRTLKYKLDGLRKQAERAKSGNGIREMLKLAAPSLAVSADSLDADVWLLNVQNGTLDLQTGQLQEHDQDQLLTKLAPVDFMQDASCPIWLDTLNQIFRDENGGVRQEEIRFLQKALGYALTGSIREHAFFIFHGRVGRNGKGTILNLLLRMMGDYATELNAGVLLSSKQDGGGAAASPGIAKLKGMRLVLASETDKGRRLNEALIKGMTGGDPITARYLHQNEFTFMPEFKLFLQTNYMPAVDGSDAGLWDRLKKLDFLRYFREEERDSALPEKLWEERSGILKWLVEGCQRWQDEGLKETADMQRSKQEFQGEMDAVPRYANENLWFDPIAQVLVSALYKDYELWCFENDEYQHKRREFYQRLETHMAKSGYRLIRGGRNSTGKDRVHKGVGLKREMPESWRKYAEDKSTGVGAWGGL